MATELGREDGQLFVLDQAIAELFGQPVTFGLRMFDDEEPQMYMFPHEGEPDVVVTSPSGLETYTLVDDVLGNHIQTYLSGASLTLRN